MIAAFVLMLAGLLLGCAASPGAVAAQYPRGAARQVALTRYSALFGNAEILRRLLSPLAQESVRESLARSHAALAPYAIDLAKERFLVYVPSSAPPSPRGFALLVFVPPWDQARLPFGWIFQSSTRPRSPATRTACSRCGTGASSTRRRMRLRTPVTK